MKTFEPGKIPKIGGEVDLKPDDRNEPSVSVTVRKSYGLAELLGVSDEHGQNGIIAFQPDGTWWWIRKIDARDPWSSDPDAWRRQADGS